MIDSIETILVDFPQLKDRVEIDNYIKSQLLKHFPIPELLIYDYLVTGRGDKRKALISYTLKDNLKDTPYNSLAHPHLLFKYILNKNGHYIVFYSDRVLEVFIDKKCITKINHIHISEFNFTIPHNAVLISDNQNSNRTKRFNNKVYDLDKLYKKCKMDLFKERKSKKGLVYVVVILSCFLAFSGIIKLSNIYNDSFSRLKTLEDNYRKLVIKSNESSEQEEVYSDLTSLVKLYEAQIPTDFYSVLYELKIDKDYRISNLTFTKNFLTVNAISKNSIETVDSLNEIKSFSFKQNSTVTKDDYEQFSFSGEVLCP